MYNNYKDKNEKKFNHIYLYYKKQIIIIIDIYLKFLFKKQKQNKLFKQRTNTLILNQINSI